MKSLIDLLCQRQADPLDTGQILDTGPGQFLQSAELLEQPLPPLRTYSGNLLQYGTVASLRATLSVGGDGESMGLVPDLLYQVQGGRIRGQYNRRTTSQQEELLHPRLAICAFCDADQGQPGDPQLLQDPMDS